MIDVGALFQQAAAALRRERHATYRLQLGAARSASTRSPRSCRTSTRSASATPTSRPASSAGPAARTATTSSITTRSTPRSAAEPPSIAWPPRCTARGLGLILDIVPNHMGIAGDANPWWMDVLENGPGLPVRRLLRHRLDAAARPSCGTRCCCPSCGDQYGQVLEAGQLQLEIRGRRLRRPLRAAPPARSRPDTYAQILSHRLEELPSALGADDVGTCRSSASILTALAHLPGRDRDRPRPGRRAAAREGGRQAPPRRPARKESARSRELRRGQRARAFNGTPGDPRSFDLLDALLAAQAYRLADWRVAGDEINYRRFFDVNDLAAIRMERPEVFAATPRARPPAASARARSPGCASIIPTASTPRASTSARLQEGALLVATAQRLAARCSTPRGAKRSAPSTAPCRRSEPGARGARPLYIVAEKILGGGRAASRVVAGGRHHRLRLPRPRSTASSSTASASRQMAATLHRASPGAPRRFAELTYYGASG